MPNENETEEVETEEAPALRPVKPGTYKSAVTGHFVTPEFAAENPDTTFEIDVRGVRKKQREE